MTDNHPYEQRITGDGENWGEIMADAFDGLMASASESCTTEELDALESHIAATLGGRKLTAEQVREAIERNVTFYEGGDYDEQEIADELNATMGGGECEDVSTKNGIFKCSECGCTVEEDGVDWGEINCCPDCMKRVKR